MAALQDMADYYGSNPNVRRVEATNLVSPQFREAALHAFEGPEEVHGGGAGFRERVADFSEFRFESFGRFCGRMKNSESGAMS